MLNEILPTNEKEELANASTSELIQKHNELVNLGQLDNIYPLRMEIRKRTGSMDWDNNYKFLDLKAKAEIPFKNQIENKGKAQNSSSADALQIFKKCKVEGSVIKLPAVQLDRKVYEEVKKALEGIGGKWKGGKVYGFVFATDPSARLEQLQGGEKINLKKDFQFFATPAHIAERLVDLAELENLTSSDALLEPSAGKGDILQAVFDKRENHFQLGACELMPENQPILKARFWKVHGFSFICPDFFEINKHYPEEQFARIIANPPFTKNQDIDHVRHMWKQLAPGGILVTITSTHWMQSTNKKELEFKNWVECFREELILLNPGEFKESGTNVPTVIVKLRKEASHA